MQLEVRIDAQVVDVAGAQFVVNVGQVSHWQTYVQIICVYK